VSEISANGSSAPDTNAKPAPEAWCDVRVRLFTGGRGEEPVVVEPAVVPPQGRGPDAGGIGVARGAGEVDVVVAAGDPELGDLGGRRTAAGLQRNMASESGRSGLLSALDRGNHDAYLENPDTLAQPTTTADGNAILGHILGSKDVSRQVAADASKQTGIDTDTLKKMLPLVAALAMGGLSRQAKTGGGAAKAAGLAALIRPLLGGGKGGTSASDVAGMLGGLFGGRRGG
jgi:hypothetical protein